MNAYGSNYDDMVTALQRADASGNHADAAQIARMIQEQHPAETQQALGTFGQWSGPPPPSTASNISRLMAPAVSPSNIAPAPTMAAPQMPTFNSAPPNSGGGASSAPPPVAAISGGGAAPPGGGLVSSLASDITDFSRSAVAAAPFNAINRAITAPLRMAINGESYANALGDTGQLADQSAQRSPIASTLGTAYGDTAALMGAGGLLRAGVNALAGFGVPVLSSAAQAAQTAAQTLGRSAIVGGAVAGGLGGAAQTAWKGGSASDVGVGAVGGAVGGAVLGPAATALYAKMAPVARDAWGVLASKLTGALRSGAGDTLTDDAAGQALLRQMKVDPAEFAATYKSLVDANGGQPLPPGAAFAPYAQGQLAKMAQASPELGNALTAGRDAFQAQGPTQVPQLIDQAVAGAQHVSSPTGNAGVQALGDLDNARAAAMKAAMDPIRGNMVPLNPGDVEALTSDPVNSALRLNRGARGRFDDAINQLTPEDSSAPLPAAKTPPSAAELSMARLQQGRADYKAGGAPLVQLVQQTADGAAPNGQAVLQHIAQNGSDDAASELAKALMKTGVNPSVKLLPTSSPEYAAHVNTNGAAGQYDPSDHSIALFSDNFRALPRREAEQTMLHEFLHAATYRGLNDEDSVAASQVGDLLQHASNLAKGTPLENAYGLRNVHEFVSEGFSNPQFRTWLTQQPAAPGVFPRATNMWQSFKNAVYRLVGAPAQSRNLFDDLMDTAHTVVKETGARNQATAGAALASPSFENSDVGGILKGWGKLFQTQPAPSAAISVDDLDTLRQSLYRRSQSSDAEAADAARSAFQAIRGIQQRDPAAAAALDQFGRHSAYIDGYTAAHSAGKPLDQIEGAAAELRKSTGPAYFEGAASGLVSKLAHDAGQSESGAQGVLQRLSQDNSLRSNIASAYGPDVAASLANTGSKLSQGAAAMNVIAPGSPVGAAASGNAASPLMHAGIDALTGRHHGTIANIGHAIMNVFGNRAMPPQVAARLAQMATDPNAWPHVVAALQRAGATEQQLNALRGYTSGLAGGAVGSQFASP